MMFERSGCKCAERVVGSVLYKSTGTPSCLGAFRGGTFHKSGVMSEGEGYMALWARCGAGGELRRRCDLVDCCGDATPGTHQVRAKACARVVPMSVMWGQVRRWSG